MNVQSLPSITSVKKPMQLNAVNNMQVSTGNKSSENLRFGSSSDGGGFISLIKRLFNVIFFKTNSVVEKWAQNDPIAYLNNKLKKVEDTVVAAQTDTARAKVAKNKMEDKLNNKKGAEKKAIKEIKEYEAIYNKVLEEHKKIEDSGNKLTAKQKKDFEGLKSELDKKLQAFNFIKGNRVETEKLLEQAKEIFEVCKNKEKELTNIKEQYQFKIETAKMKQVTANDAKKLQELGMKINQTTGEIEGLDGIDKVLEDIDTNYEVNKTLLNNVVGKQDKDDVEEQNAYIQQVKDSQRKDSLEDALKEFHSLTTEEGAKTKKEEKSIGEVAEGATKRD